MPNCNVLELKYNSDNLYVVADDYIGIVSNQKKLKTVFECGKINTVCYTFTPNDELVLAYNDYSNSTENKLVRVRASGTAIIKRSADKSEIKNPLLIPTKTVKATNTTSVKSTRFIFYHSHFFQ